MFKSISRFWSCWKNRNTPYGHTLEELELVVLAARRCAYDLSHAGNSLQRYAAPHHTGVEAGVFYCERARQWLRVFNPVDGGKHYRHRLHHEIGGLSAKVEKYRAFLADRGIDDPFPDLPF